MQQHREHKNVAGQSQASDEAGILFELYRPLEAEEEASLAGTAKALVALLGV